MALPPHLLANTFALEGTQRLKIRVAVSLHSGKRGDYLRFSRRMRTVKAELCRIAGACLLIRSACEPPQPQQARTQRRNSYGKRLLRIAYFARIIMERTRQYAPRTSGYKPARGGSSELPLLRGPTPLYCEVRCYDAVLRSGYKLLNTTNHLRSIAHSPS